ncbi:hypothetical protein BT96DRAFT_947740 [Gymnopus androsaceus JB14]|uniref:Uncharacterized protein n=1 Tax=Gymnopus androsaceus JB14 TaxID=1447944 RepID=A0A6A4GSX4_9AGAR|nr:hypothetical protein BT96DRAFT_947740 [Gymnopus androsaceus JB14]
MLFPGLQSLLGLFLSFSQLKASQIPFVALQEASIAAGSNFSLKSSENGESWDINVLPNENATGHLVFETVNSFMQHWPNTRYRNGHTIIPGIVPTGTVLYHGRSDANTPTGPEWTATDPEHSYFFCHEQTTTGGCWQLTVTAIRPLNVIYFDGSGAAKMPDGSMDSQDVLAFGEILPDKYSSEWERVSSMCDWGKGFDVDGFVRMQADLCSSASYQSTSCTGWTSQTGGVLLGITWKKKNHTRREPTLYDDTSFVPVWSRSDLAKTDSNIVYWVFRKKTFRVLYEESEAVTTASEPGSGIDWQTLIRLVVKRFANRLEMVQYILNSTNPGNSASENEELAKNVQIQLVAMLRPYMLSSIKPSKDRVASTEWASPIISPQLLSSFELTASENLILGGVLETTREICRVVTGMWVDGVMAGLDPDLYKPSSAEMEIDSLLESWNGTYLESHKVVRLEPACGIEEICELPMWPLFEQGDDVDDPQPKCVRRMAPYIWHW